MNEPNPAAKLATHAGVIGVTSCNPEAGIQFLAERLYQNRETARHRRNQFGHAAEARINVRKLGVYGGGSDGLTAGTGWSKGKAECI